RETAVIAVAAHPSLAVTYWAGWLAARPWLLVVWAVLIGGTGLALAAGWLMNRPETPRKRSPSAAAWAPRAARRGTAAVRRPRGTTGWGRTARDWLSREWDGLANWEPERWDRKWWDLFTERARTPNVPGRETPAASPETAGGSTPAKSVAG